MSYSLGPAWLGRRGKAWPGKAWRGKAGEARRGMARLGSAWLGLAGKGTNGATVDGTQARRQVVIDLEIEISIIDDLNQGHPHRTIAKRYNVSRGVVLRVAAKGGKLRKREGDVKMPEFKKVAPYCCDGDDGDLHGPWWTDTRPCRRCWVERWMRAHV